MLRVAELVLAPRAFSAKLILNDLGNGFCESQDNELMTGRAALHVLSKLS